MAASGGAQHTSAAVLGAPATRTSFNSSDAHVSDDSSSVSEQSRSAAIDLSADGDIAGTTTTDTRAEVSGNAETTHRDDRDGEDDVPTRSQQHGSAGADSTSSAVGSPSSHSSMLSRKRRRSQRSAAASSSSSSSLPPVSEWTADEVRQFEQLLRKHLGNGDPHDINLVLQPAHSDVWIEISTQIVQSGLSPTFRDADACFQRAQSHFAHLFEEQDIVSHLPKKPKHSKYAAVGPAGVGVASAESASTAESTQEAASSLAVAASSSGEAGATSTSRPAEKLSSVSPVDSVDVRHDVGASTARAASSGAVRDVRGFDDDRHSEIRSVAASTSTLSSKTRPPIGRSAESHRSAGAGIGSSSGSNANRQQHRESDDDDEAEEGEEEEDNIPCCICNVRTLSGVEDVSQSILVGCDGPCERWFHPQCLGLLAVPDDDWYCADCAADAEIDGLTAGAGAGGAASSSASGSMQVRGGVAGGSTCHPGLDALAEVADDWVLTGGLHFEGSASATTSVPVAQASAAGAAATTMPVSAAASSRS